MNAKMSVFAICVEAIIRKPKNLNHVKHYLNMLCRAALMWLTSRVFEIRIFICFDIIDEICSL